METEAVSGRVLVRVAVGAAAMFAIAALAAWAPQPEVEHRTVPAVSPTTDETTTVPEPTDVPSTTAAVPTSDPSATTAAPATTRPVDASITVSGFVAADTCEGQRRTSARVGDIVVDCWTVTNTGEATFTYHLIDAVFFRLGDPPFDVNAPTERALTLAPGEALVHAGGSPVILGGAGTWEASVTWEAFEGPEFAGASATARAEVRLDVGGTPAGPTTSPQTLPATA